MALDDQVRKNADALATELGLDIKQAFGRFLDDVLAQVTREQAALQAQLNQAVADADSRVSEAVAQLQADAESERTQALAAAKALRTGGDADLLARLAGDKRVGLGKKKLTDILGESDRFVGAAPHQVDAFVDKVEPLVKRMKGAADYRPGKLL